MKSKRFLFLDIEYIMKQLLVRFSHDGENYQGLELCYPPQP